MTDLSRLKVSLTRQGAHKVAELIKAFPRHEILGNLDGTYREIRITESQTRKNLSIPEAGEIPKIWDDVRQLGEREIENLVLLAIIFSHHQLIEAFRHSASDPMRGRISRAQFKNEKAFTNLKHILDVLGFARVVDYAYVQYDLRRLFENRQLAQLVQQLFRLKLGEAGWDGIGDIVSECIDLGFHEALGLPKKQFSEWLAGEKVDPYSAELAEEERIPRSFEFRSGHSPRSESPRAYRQRQERQIASEHNNLQTQVYEHLVDQFGEENVGTENPSGPGSVDLVVRQESVFTFYEIKTYSSIRRCIREAIGQLMEYAYWPGNDYARRLVIVSKNPPSDATKTYFQHLRSTFAIPLFYQQFSEVRQELLDQV